MKKFVGLFSVISLGAMLAACNSNPEKTVYDHLEAGVEEESAYTENQSSLQEAEEQEQQWYEEVIELGMDEYDEIVSLTDQLIASVDQRRDFLAEEKKGIDAGYEEATKAEPEIESIENEEAKAHAEEVQEAIEQRYERYQSLHDLYAESLDLDQTLYELLAQEDLNVEELEHHIDQVNNKYDELKEATDQFNQQTDTYNQAKRAFYESADLNVTFD